MRGRYAAGEGLPPLTELKQALKAGRRLEGMPALTDARAMERKARALDEGGP